VDPNALNPDPDPSWIQCFDDQKRKKKKYSRTFFLFLFLIINCNLLMSNLQEKPSALKRKHPALQKMKFIFSTFVFALLDPDCES
jgi:hypothetical protein